MTRLLVLLSYFLFLAVQPAAQAQVTEDIPFPIPTPPPPPDEDDEIIVLPPNTTLAALPLDPMQSVILITPAGNGIHASAAQVPPYLTEAVPGMYTVNYWEDAQWNVLYILKE